MFYYVNYKDNWADEMFVDGFSIMDEKEYEAACKKLTRSGYDGI